MNSWQWLMHVATCMATSGCANVKIMQTQRWRTNTNSNRAHCVMQFARRMTLVKWKQRVNTQNVMAKLARPLMTQSSGWLRSMMFAPTFVKLFGDLSSNIRQTLPHTGLHDFAELRPTSYVCIFRRHHGGRRCAVEVRVID